MMIYTVRPGDTVYQIARTYSVTPAGIIRINGLQEADQLVVGQALILPTPAGTYTVRQGDSLFSIAQRFGVSLQALKDANPQIRNPNLLQPGQVIRVPQRSFGSIAVNGYCYPSIGDAPLDTNLRHLSMLSLFSCYVSATGELTPMQGDARVIERAKAAGVRPHMVIANLEEGKGFQSETVRVLLASPAAQENLLRGCVAMMKERGYTGLDVDFEYVPAESKQHLNDFLAKARAWMHAEGFLLSSAVPPATRDNQSGILFEGFDFAAQGRYNDYVTIMTYEWGYQGGPPQAVAPINEVRRSIEFAVSRIPREKVLMGIPGYGYDWKTPWQQGTNATVIRNAGAVGIAARNGADIMFDETAQTPWFRYQEPGGQRREVWFEDARSIMAKLELAHEYRLGGLSYWTVNYEFPQNWTLVEELFQVKRL